MSCEPDTWTSQVRPVLPPKEEKTLFAHALDYAMIVTIPLAGFLIAMELLGRRFPGGDQKMPD